MTAEAPVVTLFRDYATAEKWERAVPLDALAQRIRDTTAPVKAALPWLKLARFGAARTARGSLRHDRNVIACTGVEADYDGGELGFDYAVLVAEKAGLLAIIYTSPSHTPERPRWRVLAPTEREFRPTERAHLLGRLNGLYRGVFARESWTLSQSYYYGSVAGNPAHRVEVVGGQPIDLLDDLDATWIGPPAGEAAAAGIGNGDGGEARDDAELIRRIVTGSGFHTELCALAARYVGRGVQPEAAGEILKGIMLSHPEAARDARWAERFRSIPAIVGSAGRKFAEGAEGRRIIARITHQLIARGYAGSDIAAEIQIEAERRGVPIAAAKSILAAILAETAGGLHDA